MPFFLVLHTFLPFSIKCNILFFIKIPRLFIVSLMFSLHVQRLVLSLLSCMLFLSSKLYFVWHPVSYGKPFVSLAINAINRFSFMFIPDKRDPSSFSCFQFREDFFLRDFVLFLSEKNGRRRVKHGINTQNIPLVSLSLHSLKNHDPAGT